MKKSRCFENGGKVAESPDDIMRRMAEKYGLPAAGPSSAQQPKPQPQQQPQPQQVQQNGGGIINLLKNRGSAIDKASGYARGGKIKGPGTATSDSIDAKVDETGEPIRVSNGERILSAKQDALLERIAKLAGFDTVDDFLESGTGEPVGPTIKGGKKAAEDGMAPLLPQYDKAWIQGAAKDASESFKNGEYLKGAGQAIAGLPGAVAGLAHDLTPAGYMIDKMNSTPARPGYMQTAVDVGHANDKNTGASVVIDEKDTALRNQARMANTGVSAPPQQQTNDPLSFPKYSIDPNSLSGQVLARSKALNGQEDYPMSKPGDMNSSGYNVKQTSQDGISKITGKGLSSQLYTNVSDPAEAVAGLKNQTVSSDQEGLARMARANDIRQSMIDKQQPGGIAIMGDGGIEAANAEKTARWRQDDMIDKAIKNPAAGQLANTLANGQSSLAGESLRSMAQMRGQDMNLMSDQMRNQVVMRGQDSQERIHGADAEGKQLDNNQKRQFAALQQEYLTADTQEKQAAALKKLQAYSGKGERDDFKIAHTRRPDPNNSGQYIEDAYVVGGPGGGSERRVGQASPMDEYRSAIQRANGDKAKIDAINKIAKANGVIQ